MIWVREVNSALLNHIRNLMDNLVDFHGNPVTPKVIMRKPNTDITKEQYPLVTVSSLQYGEDILHSDVNSTQILQGPNPKTIAKSQVSPTYRFKYQIDLWSQTPLHMDAMTMAWVKEHPRKHSTLNVVDSEGKNEQVCSFIQTSFKSMDSVDSRGDNIYRNVLIYDILVTVDLTKPKVYPKVDSFVIVINKSK